MINSSDAYVTSPFDSAQEQEVFDHLAIAAKTDPDARNDLIARLYPVAQIWIRSIPDYSDDDLQDGMIGVLQLISTWRAEHGSFLGWARRRILDRSMTRRRGAGRVAPMDWEFWDTIENEDRGEAGEIQASQIELQLDSLLSPFEKRVLLGMIDSVSPHKETERLQVNLRKIYNARSRIRQKAQDLNIPFTKRRSRA